ncbi:MAG: ABC transporter permease subunit [Actinomycetota bacterium]|nr:ABC transporter permease subunit [Actinomycetota bacterium]MDQ2956916.1 ABC transporter permease subunit [Actinomycetota bacterium]
MLNLIKSEVLKTRSTQVWLWMILPAVALTALTTIATVYGSIYDHEHGGDPIRYYDIFTQSSGAGIALLVIGILGLTTEFRHKTITPTLLATPQRWSLLAGKAISYALFSLFYAAICVILNFVIAIIWLDAKNVPLDFGHGVIGGVIKAFFALVLTALFGLGLGALIKNQAASMVVGILYFAIINGLLSVIPYVRKGYPYTPGGAITAFTSNGHVQGGVASDVHMLEPLVGGLVFLIWALVLLVAGGFLSLNRDIS